MYGEIFLRRNFRTAKFPYGEIFVRRIFLRRDFLTAKFPYGEFYSRRNFFKAKFPTPKSHTAKFPTAKFPCVILIDIQVDSPNFIGSMFYY